MSDAIPMRRSKSDGKLEREFLPAALEIMETPASPIGRAISLCIILFFCIAVGWACLGHVDIIATAQGQLLPFGKVKIIQPLEAGVVDDIHVQDGDEVHAGEVLVTLDKTVATADRDRIVQDLGHVELDIARWTALRQSDDPVRAEEAFVAPSGAADHDVASARAWLTAQASEQAAKLAGLDRQIAEKQAQAVELRQDIDKLDAVKPLLDEKQDIQIKLQQAEVGRRAEYLDAHRAIIENQFDRAQDNEKLVETDAATTALQQQRDQVTAEFSRQVMSELTNAQQHAQQLTDDLMKADRKLKETELRAPVDGVVQQLAIHTKGGVVTPAEALMVIVPKDQPLVLEATIANADVGFIHAGQQAEVKVETFNFTRYGLLHGHVVEVSSDAVTLDHRSGDRAVEASNASHSDSASASGGSPAYVARIALDEHDMSVDGHREPLRPGMAVTAEIKTGSRRIIEYLLAPLLKYKSEAARER